MTAVLCASRMGLGAPFAKDPDARRIIAAMNPRPNRGQAKVIDDKVQALKSAGLWAKFIFLFPFYLSPADQGARLDWISGQMVTQPAGGTVAFTLGQGFQGSGGGRLSLPTLDVSALAVGQGRGFGAVFGAAGTLSDMFGDDFTFLTLSRNISNGTNTANLRFRNILINTGTFGAINPSFFHMSLTRTGASANALRALFGEARSGTNTLVGFDATGSTTTSNAPVIPILTKNTGASYPNPMAAFWATNAGLSDAEATNLKTIFNWLGT